MLPKKIAYLGLLIPLGISADIIKNDDLIIQGSKCVGLDCVNGENFGSDTVKLKENNIRIRFHDTALVDGFGQSWNLEANASNNGGQNYFDFMVKSITKDSVSLSDGSAKAYDCSAPFDPTKADFGFIPLGEPVIRIDPVPGTCAPFPDYQFCEYTCSETPDYSTASVLKMAKEGQPNFSAGSAIGYRSTIAEGAVSVGTETLLRRVVNIAGSLKNSDLLTLQTLNSYDLLNSENQLSGELSQQLDEFEAQVAQLEQQLEQLETRNIPKELVTGLTDQPPRLPDGTVIDTARGGDMTSRSPWVNNMRLRWFSHTLQLAIRLQSVNSNLSCSVLGYAERKLSGRHAWFDQESSVTVSLKESLGQISTLYQCS
ncbi:hypothetical protein [Endozoicomonas numazuensis]|uniref:Uncharacterized protein n=1 Tax=Endozoicomonas numazuensis TaxID=1137799 RepID=A0A081NK55_9GAMM|nr:hypothetical protein [Endozoicomonas numazuensis]KEQ18828.1 hypothetical protein GZ78_01760 [Endozoicomonas numazuensis]